MIGWAINKWINNHQVFKDKWLKIFYKNCFEMRGLGMPFYI